MLAGQQKLHGRVTACQHISLTTGQHHDVSVLRCDNLITAAAHSPLHSALELVGNCSQAPEPAPEPAPRSLLWLKTPKLRCW